MGRALGCVFLIFSLSVGITVCGKDKNKNNHSMAVSVNHAAELPQSAPAQSGSAEGCSPFEDTCSSEGTEVQYGLLGTSATNIISRRNISSSDCPDDDLRCDIMNVGPYELNNIKDLTLPKENYTYGWEKYHHAFLHPGIDIGVYLLDAYIGPLGLEAIAIHSPDYVYHPISLALPNASSSRQDNDLGLQVRLGEELVVQEHFLTISQFEYLDYNEQEELLLSRMWLLKLRFAGGSHGDVWRGRKRQGGKYGLGKYYVLKRMLQEKGNYVVYAGLRETYFGQLIASRGGHPRIARFVESFYADSEEIVKGKEEFETHNKSKSREGYSKQQNFKKDADLWLVFCDEGLSLRQLLYTRHKAGNYFIYKRSPFWFKVKHSPGLLKGIVRQLLQGVSWLHRQGIIHRDIKPSNLIVRIDTGGGGNNNPLGELRIADFSSAVDEGIQNAGFYKPDGPMKTESTLDYAPPEVRLSSGNGQPFSSDVPTSYDMWSIGVVVLELILGTPEVFTLHQRTRAVLAHELERGRVEPTNVEDILFLASLANMCIYHPAAHGSRFRFVETVVESRCGIEELARALQARDPTGQGWTDHLGVDLLLRLLDFDPKHRITAEEALLHPYFCGPLDREECKRQQAVVEGIAENLMDVVHLESSLPIQTQHPEHKITFCCPTCGRKFHGSWDGCIAHTRGRNHGEFCEYDDTTLPRCISSHAMFPLDPLSGWCDVQGRRNLLEDYHSIEFNERYRFYGVYDGKSGPNAFQLDVYFSDLHHT